MAWAKIPLNNQPFSERSFKLTLDGGKRNVNIKLKLRYHDLCDYWTAAVFDGSTGKMLIDTMPVVCGVDLLGQFQHLNLGSAYIMPTARNMDLMMPDNKSLGTAFVLIWGDAS